MDADPSLEVTVLSVGSRRTEEKDNGYQATNYQKFFMFHTDQVTEKLTILWSYAYSQK